LARIYHLTRTKRIVNWIATAFTRLGIAGRTSYILTVPGRKSGKLYSTPVTAVQDGDVCWLVAPYGAVAWVLNARAAGKVTLSRGRKSEEVTVAELPAHDAATVLRVYIAKVGVTQPYFDVRPDSPIEAFEAEAPRHPVFLVTSAEA
jgi:deazaflavin-dependent oxidoreductase (nitroreductase family)